MGQAQLINFVFMLGLVAVFYFMLIRPQQKKEKQVREMRDSLKVGDRITTIGGFQGRIIKVEEDRVTIEAGVDKVKLVVEKWGIGKIQTPETDKVEAPTEK